MSLSGRWGCAKVTGCSRWTSAKNGLVGTHACGNGVFPAPLLYLGDEGRIGQSVPPVEHHGLQRTRIECMEDGGPLFGTDKKPATAIRTDKAVRLIRISKGHRLPIYDLYEFVRNRCSVEHLHRIVESGTINVAIFCNRNSRRARSLRPPPQEKEGGPLIMNKLQNLEK